MSLSILKIGKLWVISILGSGSYIKKALLKATQDNTDAVDKLVCSTYTVNIMFNS